MVKFFVGCAFSTVAMLSYCRKPPLTLNELKDWPTVMNGEVLSADGKYLMFRVGQENEAESDKLIIQAIDKSWKVEIPHGRPGQFVANNRKAFFFTSNDSMWSIVPGGGAAEFVCRTRSLKNVCDRIAYIDQRGRLIVDNFESGEKREYPEIKDYELSADGEAIYLITTTSSDGDAFVLKRSNLKSGIDTTLWEGKALTGLTLDREGRQAAFIASNDSSKNSRPSIWYYKAGMLRAQVLVSGNSPQLLQDSVEIQSIKRFNSRQDGLFFDLRQEGHNRAIPDAVNVWSYHDDKLRSQQLVDERRNSNRTRLAAVHFDHGQILQLERGNEIVNFAPDPVRVCDDLGVVLIANKYRNAGQTVRETYSLMLVSTIDGIRTPVKANGIMATISPTARFAIYYDPIEGDYFTYEPREGKLRNITKGIATSWISDAQEDSEDPRFYPRGIAAWVSNDDFVLIYDKTDIWKIDPKGIAPPLNITNRYGLKKDLVFSLVLQRGEASLPDLGAGILLSAFNHKNKSHGFYSKDISKPGDPALLFMGNYYFTASKDPRHGIPVIKAKNAPVYLAIRQNAKESPNLFATTDFKEFKEVTDIHPEKRFDWLTTELINWRTLDGRMSQGILYKPENFNPGEKYPIIFYYYEKKSDGLNLFLTPQLAEADINIPWLVSQGYLVCATDIQYKVGYPGESAYNSVVSAAMYLRKFQWVDSNRMGLNGHSFGGYETNYIVTRTHLFSAALSAAGVADCIADYGSLWGGSERPKAGEYVLFQYKFGAPLWMRPDLYVDQSPIFRTNKITTPLLLMYNKDDQNVPFSQGVEFFSELSRQGKTAWMLQYVGEKHGLLQESNKVDYTLRIDQFFGYFLKSGPMPDWMK